MVKPSVLFVREWEQQMSSSGCCGRLEGDFLNWNGSSCFPERRRIMEEAGSVYREIREKYGDTVELRIVDPRNWPALLPILVRDFRRHHVPIREALKTLTGLTVNALVVNGRLVSQGDWPDQERVAGVLSEGATPMVAAS